MGAEQGLARNNKGRCVRQAIMAVQHVFDDEGSFKDAYHKTRDSLHDRRMEALSLKPNWQRAVAFSAVGMLAMVSYEGVRAHVNTHGGHMPSLLDILKSAPLVSASIGNTEFKLADPGAKVPHNQTPKGYHWGDDYFGKSGKRK